MATLQIHTPASSRSVPLSRRANPGNLTEAGRPYLLAGRYGRNPSAGRTAFVALPKESEDAKITGATRSLDRRLLALNLPVSRMSVKSDIVKAEVLTGMRIA